MPQYEQKLFDEQHLEDCMTGKYDSLDHRYALSVLTQECDILKNQLTIFCGEDNPSLTQKS